MVRGLAHPKATGKNRDGKIRLTSGRRLVWEDSVNLKSGCQTSAIEPEQLANLLNGWMMPASLFDRYRIRFMTNRNKKRNAFCFS